METVAVTMETVAVTKANETDQSMEVPAPLESTKKARDSTKWLHKTKLCVYSVQGSCRLGSKCSFAHTAAEVQDAPNLYKTQLCAKFQEGKCTNENCPFAHGEEELRMSPNFKNKLCKWFAKGKCRNGDECGFAHGSEELRSQPGHEDTPLTPPPGFVPPPGLSIVLDEAPKKEPRVLTLDAGLLDEKAPPSLEQQVEGMAATIAALHCKMDEMVLRTQVSDMKQFLGQLSAQCVELEQALHPPQPQPVAPAKTPLKTLLKTKLSSGATPFQPTMLNCQAQPFNPGYESSFVPTYQYQGCEQFWAASDDSTTDGGGGFSSD